LRLTASDEDGGVSQSTWNLTVANVGPDFEISVSAVPLVEGQTLTFTAIGVDGSGIDPGADTLTYSWSAVGPGGEDLVMPGTAASQLMPTDEGAYWITLTIGDGITSSTRTVGVQIANADPIVSGLSGGSEIASSAPLRISGSVADAGATDELTGIADLGDGVQLPLELNSGNFKLNYQYRVRRPVHRNGHRPRPRRRHFSTDLLAHSRCGSSRRFC